MGLFDESEEERGRDLFSRVGKAFEQSSPITGFGLFRGGENTTPLGPTADFGISLAAGALRSPITQLIPPLQAINSLADALGTPDVDALADRLAKAVEGRPLSKMGEIVGELGPEFAGAVKLYSLGRSLTVKALQVNAPRLEQAAANFATKNTKLSNYLDDLTGGEKLAQFGTNLSGQMKNVALRMGDVGGIPGAAFVAKPGVERAAELIGGNLGIAGMMSALEMMDSGDINEATRMGLLAMVLGAAAEGGIIGVGRHIGRGRQKIAQQVAEKFEKSSGVKAAVIGAEREAFVDLKAANEAVAKATGALDQHDELVSKLLDDPYLSDKKLNEALNEADKLFAVEEDAKATVAKITSGVRAKEQFTVPFGRGANEPVLLNVTRATPPNPDPDSKMHFLRSLYSRILQTPEGFLRGTGVTGMRFLQKVQAAEYERVMSRATHEMTLDKLARRSFDIRKQAGEVTGSMKSGMHLSDVVEMAEKEGIAGVERRWGTDMAELMADVEDTMRSKYDELVKLGALNPMDPAELHKQGVMVYFPHVMKHMNDEQIRSKMLTNLLSSNKGMSRHVAEDIVERKMLSSGDLVEGPLRFGSQEFRRGSTGSLRDKISTENGAELWEADPVVALQRYFDALDRNLAYGKRFGFGAEAQKKTKALVISMAQAEGANRKLLSPIVDQCLEFKWQSEARRRFVQSATSLQTAAKLTFAVIPNMSQSVNTLMYTGFKNTGRGVELAVSSAGRDEVSRVLGLYESIFKTIRRSYLGQTTTDSALDRLADRTLKYTGFEAAEKFNRLIAGASGLQMVRDYGAKALSGRLRGNSWDTAARKMAALDIDLKKLVEKGRPILEQGGNLDEAIVAAIGDEGLDLAMYKAAQLTQFVPDVTRRPALWSHPFGRLATQFKTFALNQGRFMRDQVLLEAAHGNMAPLAYSLSVYPVAGELVKTTVDRAKGRTRARPDGIERYVDDMMALGSLGLVTSLGTSLQYGDMGGFLFGPTFSDFESLSEGMYQGISNNNWKKAYRTLQRQPAFTGTKTIMEAGGQLNMMGLNQYVDSVTTSAKSEQAKPATSIIDLATRKEPK